MCFSLCAHNAVAVRRNNIILQHYNSRSSHFPIFAVSARLTIVLLNVIKYGQILENFMLHATRIMTSSQYAFSRLNTSHDVHRCTRTPQFHTETYHLAPRTVLHVRSRTESRLTCQSHTALTQTETNVRHYGTCELRGHHTFSLYHAWSVV